jgi:hypothetical protein
LLDVALGAGALPEELFGVCLRGDCGTVKALRRRALRYFLALRGVASAAPSKLADAADRAIKKIGYAAGDVCGAVAEEYARVLLDLDIPLGENLAALLGGRPNWTFEDLLYLGDDPVADALHEAMVALYMEYVDRTDVQRLGVLDFAAYAVLAALQRGRIARDRAAELLKWVADQALTATA